MFRLIGSQPLSTSFLGFDRLFRDIDELLGVSSGNQSINNFPPYNLFRETDGYSIELAVAGFKKDDIKIERDRRAGTLTIKGSVTETPQLAVTLTEGDARADLEGTQRPDNPGRVLRQGIARRNFARVFNLAEDVEVVSTSMADGLLTIKLQQVKKEDDYKPEVILIGQ